MDNRSKRKEYYTDTQMQFRYTAILIALLIFESSLIAGGIYFVFSFQKSLLPLSRLTFIYFGLLCIFLFSAAINALIGIRITHKIAGPLHGFRKAIRILGKGRIPGHVILRDGDFLQDFEFEFNSMLDQFKSYSVIHKESLTKLHSEIHKMEAMASASKANIKSLKNIVKSLEEIESKLKTNSLGIDEYDNQI